MNTDKKIIVITDSNTYDQYNPVYIEYNSELSLNENLDKIDKLEYCDIPPSILKCLLDKLKTNNYNIYESYNIHNDDGYGCLFNIDIISLTSIAYDDKYMEIEDETNVIDGTHEISKIDDMNYLIKFDLYKNKCEHTVKYLVTILDTGEKLYYLPYYNSDKVEKLDDLSMCDALNTLLMEHINTEEKTRQNNCNIFVKEYLKLLWDKE